MKDTLKTPEGKIDRSGANGSPVLDQAEHNARGNPAWCVGPWSLKPGDSSPLEWWRRLPSNSFEDADRLLLLATLKRVRVLHAHGDLKAALDGDAAAAITAALDLMPITEITLETDITMAALLRVALERNAAPALVMAQITGLTLHDHEFAVEVAASWLTYGNRHSSDPQTFNQAETVLLAAFRERQREV